MLSSAQKCGSCHQHMYKSFALSYHGLALRTGSAQSATCTNCHGSHAVHANRDSMAAACASCHPGANDRFLQGRMHVFTESKTPAILYWIRLLYLAFIVVVIGGMIVHNGLDLIKRTRVRLTQWREKTLLPVHGNEKFVRMTLNERFQHGVLLVSFITLVITGFMLRYPDSWWAAPLFALSPKVAVARALLHRIAGVAMLLAGIYHIGYAIFTKRGRNLIRDIFPKFSDLKDSFAYVLYNLGLRKEKPRFDRFSYIEKSEYWAMVWGTIIMGATGLFMWFENFFMARFTKLGWDIARTIHFYEAVLAGLAILVWHFYFVVLSIDICPFKRAWITGKISEAEMLEDHPLELERIKAAEFKRLEEK